MTTPADWEARYTEGNMPWEKGAPHPALFDLLSRQTIQGSVLVPGCGLGNDVRALAATADAVLGLDIAPSAIAAAKQHPEVGGESYLAADLFALPRRLHGAFDWVFEHTCFCAIDPARRADYAAAVATALRPGGYTFAIFYLNPQMDPGESGPPFGVTPAELDTLFRPAFDLILEWPPSATFPGREGRERCRLLKKREE
jgi:SAM-dependent methyltransferase